MDIRKKLKERSRDESKRRRRSEEKQDDKEGKDSFSTDRKQFERRDKEIRRKEKENRRRDKEEKRRNRSEKDEDDSDNEEGKGGKAKENGGRKRDREEKRSIRNEKDKDKEKAGKDDKDEDDGKVSKAEKVDREDGTRLKEGRRRDREEKSISRNENEKEGSKEGRAIEKGSRKRDRDGDRVGKRRNRDDKDEDGSDNEERKGGKAKEIGGRKRDQEDRKREKPEKRREKDKEKADKDDKDEDDGKVSKAEKVDREDGTRLKEGRRRDREEKRRIRSEKGKVDRARDKADRKRDRDKVEKRRNRDDKDEDGRENENSKEDQTKEKGDRKKDREDRKRAKDEKRREKETQRARRAQRVSKDKTKIEEEKQIAPEGKDASMKIETMDSVEKTTYKKERKKREREDEKLDQEYNPKQLSALTLPIQLAKRVPKASFANLLDRKVLSELFQEYCRSLVQRQKALLNIVENEEEIMNKSNDNQSIDLSNIKEELKMIEENDIQEANAVEKNVPKKSLEDLEKLLSDWWIGQMESGIVSQLSNETTVAIGSEKTQDLIIRIMAHYFIEKAEEMKVEQILSARKTVLAALSEFNIVQVEDDEHFDDMVLLLDFVQEFLAVRTKSLDTTKIKVVTKSKLESLLVGSKVLSSYVRRRSADSGILERKTGILTLEKENLEFLHFKSFLKDLLLSTSDLFTDRELSRGEGTMYIVHAKSFEDEEQQLKTVISLILQTLPRCKLIIYGAADLSTMCLMDLERLEGDTLVYLSESTEQKPPVSKSSDQIKSKRYDYLRDSFEQIQAAIEEEKNGLVIFYAKSSEDQANFAYLWRNNSRRISRLGKRVEIIILDYYLLEGKDLAELCAKNSDHLTVVITNGKHSITSFLSGNVVKIIDSGYKTIYASTNGLEYACYSPISRTEAESRTSMSAETVRLYNPEILNQSFKPNILSRSKAHLILFIYETLTLKPPEYIVSAVDQTVLSNQSQKLFEKGKTKRNRHLLELTFEYGVDSLRNLQRGDERSLAFEMIAFLAILKTFKKHVAESTGIQLPAQENEPDIKIEDNDTEEVGGDEEVYLSDNEENKNSEALTFRSKLSQNSMTKQCYPTYSLFQAIETVIAAIKAGIYTQKLLSHLKRRMELSAVSVAKLEYYTFLTLNQARKLITIEKKERLMINEDDKKILLASFLHENACLYSGLINLGFIHLKSKRSITANGLQKVRGDVLFSVGFQMLANSDTIFPCFGFTLPLDTSKQAFPAEFLKEYDPLKLLEDLQLEEMIIKLDRYVLFYEIYNKQGQLRSIGFPTNARIRFDETSSSISVFLPHSQIADAQKKFQLYIDQVIEAISNKEAAITLTGDTQVVLSHGGAVKKLLLNEYKREYVITNVPPSVTKSEIIELVKRYANLKSIDVILTNESFGSHRERRRSRSFGKGQSTSLVFGRGIVKVYDEELDEDALLKGLNTDIFMESRNMRIKKADKIQSRKSKGIDKIDRQTFRFQWIEQGHLPSEHDPKVQLTLGRIVEILKKHHQIDLEILSLIIKHSKVLSKRELKGSDSNNQTKITAYVRAENLQLADNLNQANSLIFSSFSDLWKNQITITRVFIFNYSVDSQAFSLMKKKFDEHYEFLKEKNRKPRGLFNKRAKRSELDIALERDQRLGTVKFKVIGDYANCTAEAAEFLLRLFEPKTLQVDLRPVVDCLFKKPQKESEQEELPPKQDEKPWKRRPERGKRRARNEKPQEENFVVAFLHKLEKDFGVYIKPNHQTKTLWIYGPEEIIPEVEKSLEEFISKLKTGLISYEGYSIKNLMKNQLEALEKIKSKFQIVKSRINFLSKVIEVTGNADTILEAKREIMKQFKRIVKKESSIPAEKDKQSCPICYDDMNDSYALLQCGHSFCSVCLSTQLAQSLNDQSSIPIRCGMCTEKVVIEDLMNLLGEDDMQKLAKLSLNNFMTLNQSEFMYCLTPNCEQVFRRKQQFITCNVCEESHCTLCKKGSHPTMTCEELKEMLNPDALDAMFEKWKVSSGVKPCPNCKTDIEKNGGCQHMTCQKCHIHICWLCMKTFDSGSDTYRHLNEVHGRTV